MKFIGHYLVVNQNNGVREMREITDIKECHEILLGIAKQFVGICDKYHIRYYMLGGTMLGAVRHKGFVPWDDDMDFGVMRKDFDALLAALEKELPKQFKVCTWKNCQNILGHIVKISDERTITQELYKEGFEPIGINIDIFPLDYAKSDKLHLDRTLVSILLKRVYAYKFLSLKSRPFLKKIAASIIKILLCWVSDEMYMSWITKLDLCNEGEFIANNNGAWGIKETLPRIIFESSKKYPFEDTEFNGVVDYDSYLTHLYGDYMQLPPESKRHIHLTGLYWK